MIMYATLGAHDIKKSKAFYDKLLKPIGYKRLSGGDWGVSYGPAKDTTTLYVMKPANGLPATFGNGAMLSLVAPSRKAVDEFHAIALASGGYDEGKPGIRGETKSNFYAAYIRDPNGNKLCAVCTKPQK